MRASQIHYDNGKDYDVIDFIQDYNINFNKGNAIKYLVRAGVKTKDPVQDLYKAKDYIEREIAFHKEKLGSKWTQDQTE